MEKLRESHTQRDTHSERDGEAGRVIDGEEETERKTEKRIQMIEEIHSGREKGTRSRSIVAGRGGRGAGL